MWGYLTLLPLFLALWAIAGVWIVFAIAVANSICGSYPPQSCIFSQVLNVGAALAAWICVVRYHQLRDWGVGRRLNQLTLWFGLICVLGTSIVGNFQEKNQKPTHLVGAFFAFVSGNIYFWLQLVLSWRMKSLPQPGEPWLRLLRLSLCGLCSLLIVAMIVLHHWPLRSASAACEWALAMLLFALFGLFAVDFADLDGCALCLRPRPGLQPPPASATPSLASPTSSQLQLSRALSPHLPHSGAGSGPEPPGGPQEEPPGVSPPRPDGLGLRLTPAPEPGGHAEPARSRHPLPACPCLCSEGAQEARAQPSFCP
ncbi:PREDICTED: transmembrane protein 150B isoform X2 [Chinchilla lanigera]|uniref:transmembrane protein 150B isoform X2 n=1 Tax=Chinchilla lanigera TaxID=34839 RepID=UPI00038EA5B9|nr:PREDICTED: transmembrane protein 150B isoform X2 [Chinchilla lanigera]